MRIRSIHPQFWRSDDMAKLRRDLRLLFVGLWSYVDDNGVGLDDFRQITADLFALEDDPVGARQFVREGLATLSAASLIVRYEHAGKRYLYIPTWDKWQRVDKPGKPRYPRPDDCGATPLTSDDADIPIPTESGFARGSREPRESPAPGEGEKGRRGEGEKSAPASDQNGTDTTSAAKRNGRKRPARALPDDWNPNDAHLALARERGVDPAAELAAFRDHAAANDRRQVDWDAAFRMWLRKARPGNVQPIRNGPRPKPRDSPDGPFQYRPARPGEENRLR